MWSMLTKRLFSLNVVFSYVFFFTKYKKHASQIIGNATAMYTLGKHTNPVIYNTSRIEYN